MVAPRAGARIETLLTWCESDAVASPPVRGRGSKLKDQEQVTSILQSPPVRGRGSKLHCHQGQGRRRQSRPPCGGADRNLGDSAVRTLFTVAPRAGARIETGLIFLSRTRTPSPPVRGRGSKPSGNVQAAIGLQSPPVRGRGSKRSGVETFFDSVTSPPVRGRGSKQNVFDDYPGGDLSPPVRGRGSKRA